MSRFFSTMIFYVTASWNWWLDSKIYYILYKGINNFCWVAIFYELNVFEMVSFLLTVGHSLSPILSSMRTLSLAVCQLYRFLRKIGSKTEASQDGFHWIMLLSILKALLSMFDVPFNVFVAVCSFLLPFADFAFIKFIFVSTYFLASSYRFCACSSSICSVNSFCFFWFFCLFHWFFSECFRGCFQILLFSLSSQKFSSVQLFHLPFVQLFFPILQRWDCDFVRYISQYWMNKALLLYTLNIFL